MSNTTTHPIDRAATRAAIRDLIRDPLTPTPGMGGVPTFSTYSRHRLAHTPRWARERVRTTRVWEALERAGLVRLRIEPDVCMSMEDLKGECFAPSHADTIPGGMRTLKAQESAFESRVDREGVCGVIGEYCAVDADGEPDGDWVQVDACWGFVGDDWEGSGYDDDIRAATIAALRVALKGRCKCCRRAS